MTKSNVFIVFVLWLSMTACQNTFQHGENIYKLKCQNCHMAEGNGLRELIPTLSQSPLLRNDGLASICLILKGTEGKPLDTRSPQVMPGNPNLTPVEMTNLINFLNFKFGTKKEVIMKDVASQMQKCFEK